MADEKPDCACRSACGNEDVKTGRRSMLTGVLALAVAPIGSALAQGNARTAKPQPGDVLVYADGDSKGQPVKVADIAERAHPRFAYPMEAATKTVRDGSRINLVLLVKLKADDIGEKARPNAAQGVLAYSAVCTHYGCQITVTHQDGRSVVCNCHGSTFDAGNNGEIVVGPATRRLAVLPLKAADGVLVVAAGFSGRLGPPQQ
jgi:rieske iron-sulfur protein